MKYIILIFFLLISCEENKALEIKYDSNDLLALKKNEGFFLMNFDSSYIEKVEQRLLSMSPNAKYLIYTTLDSYSNGFEYIYIYDVEAKKVKAKIPFSDRSVFRNMKWNASSTRMSFQSMKMNKEGHEEDLIEMLDVQALKIELIYRNLNEDNEMQQLNWLKDKDHILVLKNRNLVYYFDTENKDYVRELDFKDFFVSGKVFKLVNLMYEVNISFSDSLKDYYFISESSTSIKKDDFYEKTSTALYRFNAESSLLEKLSPDSIHVTDFYMFDNDHIIFTGFTSKDIFSVADGESSLITEKNNIETYYKVEPNVYSFSINDNAFHQLKENARFLHHY